MLRILLPSLLRLPNSELHRFYRLLLRSEFLEEFSMDALLRLLMPVVKIRPPSWRIKRWLRRVGQTVLEILALVGISVVVAIVVCCMLFIR